MKLSKSNLNLLVIITVSILVMVSAVAAFILITPSPEKVYSTVELADEALIKLYNCMELSGGDARLCEDETYHAYKWLKQLDYEDTQKLLDKHPK